MAPRIEELLAELTKHAESLTRHHKNDGNAKGRATEKEIIRKASEVFSQQGFYGASLRGIARAAGVDHTTLIHHFGTKEKLLGAVVAWHDTQLGPAVVPGELSVQAIADLLVERARLNQTVPGLVQLHSHLSVEATDPKHPAHHYMQKRHQLLVNLISSLIEIQRDHGALQEGDVTPQEQAAIVISTWDGLQIYDALHPGQIDVPTLMKHVFYSAFGIQ